MKERTKPDSPRMCPAIPAIFAVGGGGAFGKWGAPTPLGGRSCSEMQSDLSQRIFTLLSPLMMLRAEAEPLLIFVFLEVSKFLSIIIGVAHNPSLQIIYRSKM